MTLFPVLVDVYHKEQLVTKEEAEEAASDEWRWENVAITKDVSTATRIADILDKYGCNYYAQHMRGKCVYVCKHNQLRTKFNNLAKLMLGYCTEY